MANEEPEESIVTNGRALLRGWLEEEQGINFWFFTRKRLVLFCCNFEYGTKILEFYAQIVPYWVRDSS